MIKIIEEKGHKVTFRKIVPDEKYPIQNVIFEAVQSPETDVIVTSGGTGVSPRDITVETVKPLIEKEILGFGEIFRFISFQQIGSAAMLTRALAGIINKKVIFCLPGSPQMVSLAFNDIILPEAGHIIKHLHE